MKIKIEIKNRWTGSVLFSYEKENNTIKETLLEAIKVGSNLRGSNLSGSNLSGSNLRGSNLSGSNLSGSNLSGSNLSGSDLRGSNLSGSNLSGSDLSGSDLSGSDLSGSNLRGSDLSGSDLSGSNLRGSNLSGSNLSGSNLSGSDLSPIKADFYLVLLNAIPEIPKLRQSLVEGKVDGSTYEGACACLVGTIANIKQCSHRSIEGIAPDSSRPAERFFLGIKKDDTPETNQVSKIAVEWIDEFLSKINHSYAYSGELHTAEIDGKKYQVKIIEEVK